MSTNRLEAFSDGVLAIIITIAVLSIQIPGDASLSTFIKKIPTLLIYAWSFQTIGTYWVNHHQLIRSTQSINGRIMWSNLLLLFWLSLVPFTTAWLGSHFASTWPTVAYAAVLLFAALAYNHLTQVIILHQGENSKLRAAIGTDGKGRLSLVLYMLAILCTFLNPYLSYLFIVLVAAMWLVPDRRLSFR